MADRKITDLPELTTISDGDFVAVVDVSDTTESAEGTSKKIQKVNLVGDGGSTERIAQFYNQGFRINGAASPVYYGADQFPAFFNLDFSTGQSDETLLTVSQQRAVWQAPFDCKIENFYFFLNETNVEVALYKSDIDFMNGTLFYHNTDTTQTKNDRSITSTTTINAGDFVHLFVKRPDGTPTFLEGAIFIDFKEVI
jgi:hypothetical protein